MKELTTIAKRWGNSVGVIVPSSFGIKEGQKITIYLEPKQRYTKVKDIFGRLKLGKSVSKIMKEVDKELDSEV